MITTTGGAVALASLFAVDGRFDTPVALQEILTRAISVYTSS